MCLYIQEYNTACLLERLCQNQGLFARVICARHFFFQGTFSFAELPSQIEVLTYLGENNVGLCFASSAFSLQLLWLFPKEAIGGGQFTMHCQ